MEQRPVLLLAKSTTESSHSKRRNAAVSQRLVPLRSSIEAPFVNEKSCQVAGARPGGGDATTSAWNRTFPVPARSFLRAITAGLSLHETPTARGTRTAEPAAALSISTEEVGRAHTRRGRCERTRVHALETPLVSVRSLPVSKFPRRNGPRSAPPTMH